MLFLFLILFTLLVFVFYIIGLTSAGFKTSQKKNYNISNLSSL